MRKEATLFPSAFPYKMIIHLERLTHTIVGVIHFLQERKTI